MILYLDVETTGLDPETCQVLEIGCVLDDFKSPEDELPKFEALIKHARYEGEPYALSMHPELFRRLADGEGLTPKEAMRMMAAFLNAHAPAKVSVCGKNLGTFDLRFLRRLPQWESISPRLHRRVLDPGSMLWKPGMERAMSLDELAEHLGLETKVKHTALSDACLTMRVVRAIHGVDA